MFKKTTEVSVISVLEVEEDETPKNEQDNSNKVLTEDNKDVYKN